MRLRFGERQGYVQTLSVRRVDHAAITYLNSQELIASEDNGKIDAIISLEISCSYEEGKASILFEKDEKTVMKISSDERDSALLMSADMKEYLKSEVFIHRFEFLNRILFHRTFPPLFFVTMTFPIALAPVFSLQRQSLNVSRQTLEQKIDFLVQSQIYREILAISPIIGGYFSLSMIALFLLYILILKNPPYVFYIGKGISRYDGAKSVRDKVFWGVLVALVTGVVGSIIAGKINL